jgi:hypothetical protein
MALSLTLDQAIAQIAVLTRENIELKTENKKLADLAAIAMVQKEADKDLDRPWQTQDHGHYEYIETICEACDAGLAAGLAGMPLAYPHTREHPDQNAAYEIGHVAGTAQRNAASTGSGTGIEDALSDPEREIVRKVFAHLESENSKPDGPGHCHDKAGIWDQSNRPEIAGKPCEWCALWRKFAALAALTLTDSARVKRASKRQPATKGNAR